MSLLCVFPCTGHKKYVGFLYLYTAYNNAVVHVFTNLLKSTIATNTATKTAIAAPETANIEEMKTSNSDVELVQVEQKQRDIHLPSCESDKMFSIIIHCH